jgi:DNA polymerase-4
VKTRQAEPTRVFAHVIVPALGSWPQVVEICGDYSSRLLPSPGGRELSLDLTGLSHLLGPPKSLALEIRNRLRGELGIEAALGLGPTALVACLAAQQARPGEALEIAPRHASAFLGRTPVAALPGVDPDWARWLSEMGLRLTRDLASLSEEAVARAFGERGRRLWELAQGRDPVDRSPQPIFREADAPSVSAQVDLRPPSEERRRVRSALRIAAEEVARQLRHRGDAARQVRLEIVFEDLRRLSLRRTLPRATCSRETIAQAARALYDHARLGRRAVRRVRLSAACPTLSVPGRQLSLPLSGPETDLCSSLETILTETRGVHTNAPLLSRNRAGRPV